MTINTQGWRPLRTTALAAIAACMLGGSALAASSSAGAAFCATDKDLAALNTRVLQTELMVAALSCGQRQQYNTFVTTHQQMLINQGRALQVLFNRAHGAQGANRMNAFVTRLANDASQQVRSRDDYCLFMSGLFDEAMATSPEHFSQFVNKPWIVGRHGYRSCVVEASRHQPN